MIISEDLLYEDRLKSGEVVLWAVNLFSPEDDSTNAF